MRKKSLIVTADDFGCDHAVNAAVVRAHREGILRFASMMVLRPCAAQAAALAKENPGLGVGLHLELCARRPARAGLNYFFDRKARAGLEGEIRGQIEALLTLGIQPTHVDGHCSVHVHPVIFPALCRLAREYGIPRVRLPQGELSAYLGYPGADDFLSPLLLAGVFAAVGGWVRGAAHGLEIPRTWGLLRSGTMTEDYVLWLLDHLPDGVTELYFHPSADPDSRANGRPTPTHRSVVELETLLSPRVRRHLDETGVLLVSRR
ncbi:MAG: ChbG/HpnK family deacetylase [Elusimicrobiota bacterium]